MIYVIDDEPAIRELLRSALVAESLPVQVFGSAGSFLEALDPRQPGCIVLDLKMPEMDGLALLRRLRKDEIRMPIVVISGHAGVPEAVASMKLGAIDVLQKPFSIAALVALVRGAMQKSVESCQSLSRQQEARQRFAGLTPRELELVKHVVSGSSSKQIARDLHISVKTVANHRAHVMAKSMASNAADLARMAATAGIIESQ
jgi:two-component system response regulator FixJ